MAQGHFGQRLVPCVAYERVSLVQLARVVLFELKVWLQVLSVESDLVVNEFFQTLFFNDMLQYEAQELTITIRHKVKADPLLCQQAKQSSELKFDV